MYRCEAELKYGEDFEHVVYYTLLSDENSQHMVEFERLPRYPAERVTLYFRTTVTKMAKADINSEIVDGELLVYKELIGA